MSDRHVIHKSQKHIHIHKNTNNLAHLIVLLVRGLLLCCTGSGSGLGPLGLLLGHDEQTHQDEDVRVEVQRLPDLKIILKNKINRNEVLVIRL